MPLQSSGVPYDKLQVKSSVPQEIPSQFPNELKFHLLDVFQQQWAEEALRLRTPYCEIGEKLLSHLQNPQTRWSLAETFNDISLLFAIEPTFDHVITDIYSAENDGSLSLMDTVTASNNGADVISAQTILDCIEAIEERNFSTKRHRHLSAFNVPISKNGLITCCPKTPPKEVLTKMKLKPVGTIFM